MSQNFIGNNLKNKSKGENYYSIIRKLDPHIQVKSLLRTNTNDILKIRFASNLRYVYFIITLDVKILKLNYFLHQHLSRVKENTDLKRRDVLKA